MKSELKVLYRKDKKLAKQVAKVLGYKIKSSDFDDKTKKIVLSDIKKVAILLNKITKRLNIVKNNIDKGDLNEKLQESLKSISNVGGSLLAALTELESI